MPLFHSGLEGHHRAETTGFIPTHRGIFGVQAIHGPGPLTRGPVSVFGFRLVRWRLGAGLVTSVSRVWTPGRIGSRSGRPRPLCLVDVICQLAPGEVFAPDAGVEPAGPRAIGPAPVGQLPATVGADPDIALDRDLGGTVAGTAGQDRAGDIMTGDLDTGRGMRPRAVMVEASHYAPVLCEKTHKRGCATVCLRVWFTCGLPSRLALRSTSS